MLVSYIQNILCLVSFLGLVQIGFAQGEPKLNSADLNRRLTAYLSSPEVKQSKSLDDIFGKIVPGSLNLAYKSGRLELSYSPKRTMTAQERTALESDLKTKILVNLLGNFQGGLLGTESLENLLKKAVIFPVSETVPGTLSQPNLVDGGFDIGMFKQRLASLMANPDTGSLASVNKLNSLVKLDIAKIEWSPGKSLKIPYTPISSGPLTDGEAKEVESIIKGRLVEYVLGNYQGGMVSTKTFNEILATVSVEKFRNPAEVVGLERTPDWYWSPQSTGSGTCNTQPILIRGQVHPLRIQRVGIPEQVPPIDPNLSSAKAYGLAMECLKTNRSSLALALLDHILKEDASNPVIWFLKAIALYDLGNDAEGIEAAKKAESLLAKGSSFQSVGSALESIQGPRREFLKYAVTGVWVP